MSNEFILAAKLIVRDMRLMTQGSNRTPEGQQVFFGMGLALRHFYIAVTGRTPSQNKISPLELMKWVDDMPAPQLPDGGRMIPN